MDNRELELPYDFHTVDAIEASRGELPFELSLPSGHPRPEALLAALFCIQLFRYSGQPRFSLPLLRLGPGPGRGVWPLEVQLSANILFGDLIEEISSQVRRDPVSADSAGARASVSWVTEGADVPTGALLSRTDLDLMVRGQRAVFTYNPARFKPASIARFASHLKALSQAAATTLDARISLLPLLLPEERRWLDSVGSGQEREACSELAHETFEKRVEARPDSVAIRHRESSITYAELNARANRLARRFRELGVAPENRIVVRMPPSPDGVVALLGILKAGAVYVPMDPAYPEARVRAMTEDTQPTLTLTPDSFAELEREAKKLSGENPAIRHDPGQTAYIYYTSGTTGRPKGAMASQANLASYLQVGRERYDFGPADVMPAIARFSFSISMFELMTPLTSGATLIILDREHVVDPGKMARTFAEVTFFHAGPSLLKTLLPQLGTFPGVRHASSGGDMVPPAVLESLKDVFPKAEVFVIYGCSEISCMGCTYPVPRDRKIERTFVGRPFDGMKVRVLDHAGNVVPVGVVGEIHFSGRGVVKGYLNLDELSREKFVEIEGNRYYRTGDLGRFSEDGWLEIVGRGDFQVKIRGMRVELGEVEQHLRAAPGVRDSVAAAHETGDGEKILVAYVIPDAALASAPAGVAEIRRYLEERLPDYMVPAAFVVLEKFPLNHNMKLDRKALPAPREADRRASSVQRHLSRIRAPETQTEKALGEIWKRLLKVEQVGLDDGFFDLGGDSLLGIRLLLAMRTELGTVLDGMDVLRESLEVQAAICDEKLGRKRETPAAARAVASEEFEPFHFGRDGSLYGVLYGARAAQALLVCSPIGVEGVRSHFVIRQLAKKLAPLGVPVMRFDYFGCGDSLGPSAIDGLARWESDIEEACLELRRRTGAARIAGLGVRSGAPLLSRNSDRLGISPLIFWDPVRNGSEYLAELTAAHTQYLLSQGRGRAKSQDGGRELLGMTFSMRAINEIQRLELAEPASLSTSLDWCDVAQVDQIFSDAGISDGLAKLVREAL